MGRFLFLISALLLLVMLVSCSEESNPVGQDPVNDTIAPYAITDLSVLNTKGTSVTLTLTAQGDDSLSGRAKEYDVRYSTSVINAGNFNSAAKFTYNTQPSAGGLPDTITVTGLSGATTYYFAVKIGDEVPNWSPISNVVSTKTLIAGNWTIYRTSNTHMLSDTVLDFKSYNAIRYFTSSGGVSKLINNQWDTVYTTGDMYVDSLGDTTYLGSPKSISIDPNGIVWLGLPIAGVAKIENTMITVYNNQNSGLTSNAVTDVLYTNSGIWVGTTFSGLFKFDGDTTWTQYTTANSNLTYNGITSLAEDLSSNVWIGLNFYGMDKFDGANFTAYNGSSNGFVNKDVWDIDVSNTNQLLMSVNLDGVFTYDGATFIRYDEADGLVDNNVTAVAYDNNGHIWAGTQYGLSMFNGTDWITYTTANSQLPGDYINCLDIDMFGNLLIGTNSGAAILEIQ